MKLVFDFSEDRFVDLCVKNSQRNATTIFQDIYDSIAYFLSTSIEPTLGITEIKDSHIDRYYDKHLSLREYGDNGFIDFWYSKIDIYSRKENPIGIEDVFLPAFISLIPIDYGFGVTRTIKVKEHNLKTKNKVTVELIHMQVRRPLIERIRERTNGENVLLRPSALGVWEWRQTFYNKITGEVYFCKCFEKAIRKSGFEVDQNDHIHIRRAISNNSFRDSICHLCTNTNSDLFYCHPMYGSAFKVKYGAYIKKTQIENGIDEREAENIVREKKGVAKIGESWLNETLLFNYIDILFPGFTVEREASPSWLGKQRLDVYIPEIGLAIEYQGEQHFIAIDLFGGNEGLKRTKERDKEKLLKCRDNNVELVYFTYKDALSEKLVATRLKKYLSQKHNNAIPRDQGRGRP